MKPKKRNSNEYFGFLRKKEDKVSLTILFKLKEFAQYNYIGLTVGKLLMFG
jgi:hypothetical protein